MIVVFGIILAIYCILILAFSIGFTKVKNFNTTVSTPLTKFSIVIPFRNESENLPELLESLSALNYPKKLYEILFIDDDSDDDSVIVINDFIDKPLDCACLPNRQARGDINIIKSIRKSKSPKKDAIETAILQSQFDWILTTDADCSVPKDWLVSLDAFIQKENPNMIAAPVSISSENSLLAQFQSLDFFALQATTIGAFGIGKPFLCNGANLCYKKEAFLALHGFEGNKHIASGDDIFLMEKMIASYPDKVKFLKSEKTIVLTKPEPTLKQLISQRVRWAAKSTAYKNPFSKFVSLIVFSMNLILIILAIGSLIGYFSWLFLFGIFILKFCIDFIFLFQITTFFKRRNILVHYFWSSIIYPIFIIFIALKSFTASYQWKGRVFKK